jgi:hypothetical protein
MKKGHRDKFFLGQVGPFDNTDPAKRVPGMYIVKQSLCKIGPEEYAAKYDYVPEFSRYPVDCVEISG